MLDLKTLSVIAVYQLIFTFVLGYIYLRKLEKQKFRMPKRFFKIILIYMITMFWVVAIFAVVTSFANPPLINYIKNNEGLSLHMYKDPEGEGIIIGYGHNLSWGIDIDMAEFILYKDIAEKHRKLRIVFENFDRFPLNVRIALTDMMFCMDLGDSSKGFLSFQRMIQCIRKRDWTGASREMLDSKWARKYKSRARRGANLMSGRRHIFEDML